MLYPIPATDAAKLQLNGFKGNVAVTITDMMGKIVWQQDKLINKTYVLPLSNLAAGLYIVTIRDEKTIRSIKLVKSKYSAQY